MASGMSAEEVAFYIRMHDEMSGPMEQAKQNVEGFGDQVEKSGKKTVSTFDWMKKSFLEVKMAMAMVSTALNFMSGVWNSTAGVILTAAQAAGDFAATTGNLSQTLDITSDEVQRLQHLAAIQDVSFQQLAVAHSKLARAASDAARGQKEQADSFRALGVEVTDSHGRLRNIGDLFGEVGEKLRNLENGTQRAALAQKLLGESGGALIPVFNLGRDGIAKLKREADEMGIVMEEETIKGFRDMRDSITRLDETWQAFTRDAVTPYASAIGAAADETRTLLNMLREIPSTAGMATLSMMEGLPGVGGMASGAKSWMAFLEARKGGGGGGAGGGGGGWGSPEDAWNKAAAEDRAAIAASLAAFSPEAATSGAIDLSAITGMGPGAEMVGTRAPGGFGEKESSKMQDQLAEELSFLEAAATQRENLVAESEQKISKIKNETWKSREAQEKSHLNRLIGFEQSFGSAAATLAQAGFMNAKAAGRAQALISTYVGAAKALELPFPANIAAWAQVLATGKQAIKGVESASIGGGSISGGGGGGSIGGGSGFETAPPAMAAEPTAPEKPGTIVNLTIRALNPAEAAETLAPEIEKIARDGRVSIAVRNE